MNHTWISIYISPEMLQSYKAAAATQFVNSASGKCITFFNLLYFWSIERISLIEFFTIKIIIFSQRFAYKKFFNELIYQSTFFFFNLNNYIYKIYIYMITDFQFQFGIWTTSITYLKFHFIHAIHGTFINVIIMNNISFH